MRSDRSLTRRQRRDTVAPGVALLRGAVTLAVLGLLAFLALQSPRQVPFSGAQTVYADLPETGNLRVHSEVRAHGVRIGEVTEVRPGDDGGARVRLKLDAGTALPADSTAASRGKGLLGARFVEITPGAGRAELDTGDTLAAADHAYTLSVPDALETFDAETRGGLRSTLNELGAGVLGRGRDLNRVFEIAPPGGRATIALVDHLDSAATRRLVPSLAAASAAIDSAREDLAAGFAPADRALRPFVDRRAATRATLDAAPPALAAAEPAFSEGRRLLAAARSLAKASARTLPKAPAGLRETAALLRGSPRPLKRTAALLDEAGPTVPSVLRITRALDPLLPQLRGFADPATPIVAGIAPYSCDLVELGDNWRSVLNQGIPGGGEIGPLTSFRITAMASTESIAAFSDNPPGTEQEPFAGPCKYSSPPPRYEGLR